MNDGNSNADRYDILIIGGGINGCGIARDAAGRGYSVALCEAGDFGGGTSSASTKLIHGGLRYLEHYEFRLVREALMEREVLWSMAPHIIWPLRFVLPHHKGLRPRWLLRIGLFLYDYMGGRKLLPPAQALDLKTDPAGEPLRDDFATAFEYSDCWVEDSRLVVLNAMDARDRGANIMPRTEIVSASPEGEGWCVSARDKISGKTRELHTRLIINAAGPWVDHVLRTVFGQNDVHNVRLVRGSHIVIKRKFEHERCYIFQNADDRIIFAIPYERDFTLIGTTDAEQKELDGKPEITTQEADYLREAAGEYFKEPIAADDIVWTYSGVRPLFDDGATAAQEATRDYVLRTDETAGAPLVNIFGGKITTYRRLAESMLEEVERLIGAKGSAWTRGIKLPGGDFPTEGFDALVAKYAAEFPSLDRGLVRRLLRAYGTKTSDLLAGVQTIEDLGQHFGADLYEREVRYQMDHEWSRTSEDVLFRRTRLGIRFNVEETVDLDRFMSQNRRA